MKKNVNFGEISKHVIKNNHLIITKHLYEKSDIDLGEQDKYTPMFDIERMCNFIFINTINEDENENICIMYNLEILEYFLVMGFINKKYTFCYDSFNEYRFAKLLEMRYHVKNSINYIDIRDMVVNGKKNNPKRLEKIMAKKHFDVVFTNPPYNKNLDLKMIKTLFDHNITDKVVCVHPATFLMSHNENNNTINSVKEINKLEEVTFFWGNGKDVFDTTVANTHCISIWNKNHNTDDIVIHDKAFTERKEIYDVNEYTYNTKVNDITVHSAIAEKAAKILKKFFNCDSIIKHATDYATGVKTPYGFKFPPIRPGLDFQTKRDYGSFFSCFGKGKKAMKNALVDDTFFYDLNNETKKKNYGQLVLFYFNTNEERTNFINYLKLKCVRFLLSLYKFNTDLTGGDNTRTIPWMDFTKHYTEEDLKKAWGIDEELWDYIDKFIPDYYEDYKEISK